MNFEKIKKNYDRLGLFQIVLFIPFSFGLFSIIIQCFMDYKILNHYSDYKPGILVVSGKKYDDENSGYGAMTHTYSVGTVNGVHIELLESRVRQLISKENIKINDTIYVWYRNDGLNTLPRLKGENKIKLGRYLHAYFRSFTLIGILPFVVLTMIVRRIKKKYIINAKIKSCNN